MLSAIATVTTVGQEDARYFGDALIMTPGFDPESDPRMAQVYLITQGPKAESFQWKTKALPLGATIAGMCIHKEGPKDGPGFVGGEVIGERRKAQAMKQLTFVGLDIDTGMRPEAIDEALIKLGCVAVRYTTHSNMKTVSEFLKSRVVKFAQANDFDPEDISIELIQAFMGRQEKFEQYIVDSVDDVEEDQTERGFIVRVSHCPVPKNRIVAPFLEPYVMAKEAAAQKDAIDKWKKVPAALAQSLGVPIDSTGVDPSRLFYYPRHEKGAPFECRLFGGELFDWRTLELDDPYLAAAADMQKAGKGRGKSTTPEGQKLGKWAVARAQGFQIVDVLREHCEDKIRAEVAAGIEIECPFDEDHGNAGDTDDRACMAVNAGDGLSEVFTITCRHESCQDKTMLDMLGKIIKDGWFPAAVIDEEEHNALATDQHGRATTKAELAARIDKLTPACADDDVLAIQEGIASIASAVEREALSGALAKKLKVSKASVFADVKSATKRRETTKPTLSPGLTSAANRSSRRLEVMLGRPAVLPPNVDYLEEDAGLFWFVRNHDQLGPQRLFSYVEVSRSARLIDRGGDHVLRLLVPRDDVVIEVDVPNAELAGAGIGVVKALLAKGVKITPEGEAVLLRWLRTVNPPPSLVVHRPGLREIAPGAPRAYVYPSGTSYPSDAGLELAVDARMRGITAAGTFEMQIEHGHALFAAAATFPLMALGVLLGLAAPVNDVLRGEGAVFLISGPTSTAKSSIVEVAAAAWGEPNPGKGGRFAKALGTANSLELILEQAGAGFLGLDEVGRMAGAGFNGLLFLVQGGVGRARMTREIALRSTAAFAPVVAGTSEADFAAILAAAEQRADGGSVVRFMPVTTGGRQPIDDETFQHLKGFKANCGHYAPSLVEHLFGQGLVDEPERLAKALDRFVRELTHLIGRGDDIQVRRAARMPALLRLTGEIAIDAGLAPQDFNCQALVEGLWREAMAGELAPTEKPGERAVRQVVDKLVALQGSEIVEFAARNEARREVLGYAGAFVGGVEVWVVRSDRLGAITPEVSGRDQREALEQAGYLVRGPASGRTWSGFPGLGKAVQYVVLRADALVDDADGGRGRRGVCRQGAPNSPPDSPPQTLPA